MIKNEEIKKLVEEAAIAASAAEASPSIGDAQATALISIAKSLAVIAGVLEKVTNGNAVINVYDTSGPIL